MIAIRRRDWQCPCGSDGAYAAADLLGLNGRFSRVVQKHRCRLAAAGRRASENLGAATEAEGRPLESEDCPADGQLGLRTALGPMAELLELGDLSPQENLVTPRSEA